LSKNDHLTEKQVSEVISTSLVTLEEEGIDSRRFAPIISNLTSGELIDGYHREAIDSEWPKIEEAFTDRQDALLKLVLNLGRRRVPPIEIRELLTNVAEVTGWNPHKIAEKTGMPYSTVLGHIPEKYKRKYKAQDETVEGVVSDAIEADEQEAVDRVVPDTTSVHDRPEPTPTIPQEVVDSAIPSIETVPPNANYVDVEFENEEDDEPARTPEDTALEVYARFPNASGVFVNRAIMREHGITKTEAEQIALRLKPEEKQRPRTQLVGCVCPVCGTWKSEQAFKRAIRTVRQKNPELATLVEDELGKVGFEV